MSRRGNYAAWKPSGYNDFTSTYLRRAELIHNKEKKEKEEKDKACNCGCKDQKKNEQRIMMFDEKPSDFILTVPKKNEYYMVVDNPRPYRQPVTRARTAYPMSRSYSHTTLPSSRIVVETTIEHPTPQPVTTSYYRPTSSYYKCVPQEQYIERVYYPEERRSSNGFYYCEPVIRGHQDFYPF